MGMMGQIIFAVLRGAAAAVPAQAHPPGSDAARILPLGDSLTLGVQGQGGGYRSPLGVALKGYSTPYNAGFVGGLYLAGDHSSARRPRHCTHAQCRPCPARRPDPDARCHSGYSGHTIQGIEGAVRAARTVELNKPTHILLLGGTNDFYFYPPLGANARRAPARASAAVPLARADCLGCTTQHCTAPDGQPALLPAEHHLFQWPDSDRAASNR